MLLWLILIDGLHPTNHISNIDILKLLLQKYCNKEKFLRDMKVILQWTTIIPLLAWILLLTGMINDNSLLLFIAGILLILSVMSAVHHSEIIALRVGEPYGTIILAIAVTIIEVSIIVSLMLSGGSEAATLARDTVLSATMLILNGIVGMSLFIGGLKHHEQDFSKHSATIALVSLVSIVSLTLIIPTFTTSLSAPTYTGTQLTLVTIACIVIYGFFLFAQTKRHRLYFVAVTEEEEQEKEEEQTITVSNRLLILSLAFLLISLGIVVLLAKELSPAIEQIVVGNNLPKKLVGIIIAAVVLLPEGIAALIAAKNNKLQTSLNLALGSALATIGLTVPCVAVVANIYDLEIVLGLDIKSILLLGLSVFTVMLSLASGRTNIVYGVVLLVNLFTFIFLVIFP